jgi:hypothetical protein
MIFLKRIFICDLFLLLLVMAGTVMAADDVTERALKLYEKHHYEEASHLLGPALATMDISRQAAASLALGMIYLASAKLYRELHQTAIVIELDYLTQLSKQKSGSASSFVNFYLGQALVEAGRPAEGAAYLQRFVDQLGAKSPMKPIADIELGIAFSRQKLTQKAEQQWSGLDTTKPEIKAALAGAYAATGAQQYKPVMMADSAMLDARKSGSNPGVRMNRSLLRAYSQGGATVQALDLLGISELKNESYVEDLGSSKTISFYDLGLLDDIAKTHLGAAVLYLELASKDVKFGGISSYYLADAYLQKGNAELSLNAAARFRTEEKFPTQYRDNAQIQQAIALGKTGQKAESAAIWHSLTDKSAENPSLLAALIQACTPARADCVKVEQLALAAVEKGEGKKFFSLNAALGKYYLLQKDYSRALLFMEAGRDKAYKNKIEVNDPAMLVRLAEAYYLNKKFSENLEIYFEIGKQYPYVRQIQEAMQGIYSMEHQSAGEVKIF